MFCRLDSAGPTRRSRATLGVALSVATMLAVAACAPAERPTPEAFVADAENRLLDAWIRSERASWVQSNFITVDTQAIAADAVEAQLGLTAELARAATAYAGQDLAPDVRRKLDRLRGSSPMAAPGDAAKQAELAEITTWLEAEYGAGKYCPEGREGECLDLGELSRVIATSSDPAELLDAWKGWRTVSPPMKERYARFVELANEGARERGFTDTGAMWRSNYDMEPDEFAAEMDRLWEQVRPLYEQLHCFVRARLSERYGADVVPPEGAIPAHLLGNMWAQSWGNLYDRIMPREARGGGIDVTRLLHDHDVTPVEMVRIGERFFSSLGFDPLPETFWERSLFVKPADREVVCHASAWNLDWQDDLRIKMCIEINEEDFVTIHHELGHNYYQRAYNAQPPLFQDGANDGFHEGIGDTLALSITPGYLTEIGLLEGEPQEAGDREALMRQALEKIAFLPFGLMIDKWRWQVFSGEVGPEQYNDAWWRLRETYQGIAAPVDRPADAFDPGAKYHIPANTPYARYFLAHILQFQFHRGLCATAGYEGPLHRCSIYGSEEAGAQLNAMLELGASRPWPDALEVVTGERTMDAGALLEYFAPLATWLEEQNAGRTCGW